MAAGRLTVTGGRNFPVDDDSCFSAIEALRVVRENVLNAVCNADPLVSGKTVTFTYPAPTPTVVYTVSSITATPLQAADLGSRPGDWVSIPFLLQALLIVAAVFMLFNGYRSGDKT